MFVELGYIPTVLLAPIRSPANKLLVKFFFLFVSEHCGIFYLKFLSIVTFFLKFLSIVALFKYF